MTDSILIFVLFNFIITLISILAYIIVKKVNQVSNKINSIGESEEISITEKHNFSNFGGDILPYLLNTSINNIGITYVPPDEQTMLSKESISEYHNLSFRSVLKRTPVPNVFILVVNSKKYNSSNEIIYKHYATFYIDINKLAKTLIEIRRYYEIDKS